MKYSLYLLCILSYFFAYGQSPDPVVLAKTNVAALNSLHDQFQEKANREFEAAREAALRNGWPLFQTLLDGSVWQLIKLDSHGNPMYYGTNNINSAAAIHTDSAQMAPYNLDGTGIIIGEWDGGNIRETHEQLNGRVTNNDGAANSAHSTHVAGTMIGDGTGNANAKGMAPAATIQGYDFFSDDAEMTTFATGGALLSNHSYGFISGWYYNGTCAHWSWFGDPAIDTAESYYFGFYGVDAVAWDQIAYNAPYYLIVKSAGNDRSDYPGTINPAHSHNTLSCGAPETDGHFKDGNGGTGYDCILSKGSAKNVLTIGAIEDDGVTMSSFSGWGPVDDGRIKPDIVANGIALTSASSASNTAYAVMSGTSMSAPSVTGSCALLQQRFFDTHGGNYMLSATLKGLIIHTADDIGPVGPDYQNGWGRMNTLDAVRLIDEDTLHPESIQELILNNDSTYSLTVYADGTEPLEVTIAWTDVPGVPRPDALDDTTANLVNDLDLRLTRDTTTYFPYKLDGAHPSNLAITGDNNRDNVERIYLPNPTPGIYTISVGHKGSLDSSNPQDFSLLVSGTAECLLSAACKNITIYLDSLGQDTISTNDIENGSIATCGILSVTLSQSVFTCADTGTRVIDLIITDSTLLTDTCQALITVLDTLPPIITCPGNLTVSNDSGMCGAVVNYSVTANDNCSGTVITQTAGMASGSFYPIGTTFHSFKVTDASGYTDSCSFTIKVVDNEKPVITCPADISLNSLPGQCGAPATYLVTATDNCPGDTIIRIGGLSSGSFFPVGTTVNTYKVEDAAGNADTCSFTVTVTDIEFPTITCPANITRSTAPGDCDVVIVFPLPTFADNCPNAQLQQVGGLQNGSAYPVGIDTIVFEVTDASGNSSYCSFTITVNDNEAPDIACPFNATLQADQGKCDAVVNYFTPLYSDNCPGVILQQTKGLPSGSAFPLGTTLNTFRVVDASGNTDSCGFLVTVYDAEPPTISCPANITVSNDSGSCGAVVNYSLPTINDNCSAVLKQTAGLASGSIFPLGTTTNSFRVTDDAGNKTSCSFTVTVTDDESPVISCPSNISVTNDSGQCGAVVLFNPPLFSDNCAGSTLAQTAGLPSGALFPIGISTITYEVTDTATNNASCSFTVTVSDTTRPVITCPADILTTADAGQCGAVVNYSINATDNCPGDTIIQSAGLPSGSLFPTGTTINTFRATDAHGNMDSCSFTITVTDQEAPVFVCNGDIIQPNDPGLCEAVVNFPTPVATDNCGIVSVVQQSGPASGSVFAVGKTPVSFVAADTAGNQSSCSFFIIVQDTAKPQLTQCPQDIVQCDPLATWTPPTATDNCGFALNGTHAPGSTFPVGKHTVTYTAVDTTGNVSSCSFTVTILSPIQAGLSVDSLLCYGDTIGAITLNATGGTGIYTYQWNPPVATGNTATGLSTGSYSITISDSAGCSRSDTILLTQPDSLSGFATIVDASKPGVNDGSIDFTPMGGTPPYSYWWSNNESTQDIANLSGNQTYTLTLTDANGCEKEFSFTVQAGGNAAPVPDGPGHVIYPNPTPGRIQLAFTQIPAKAFVVKVTDQLGRPVLANTHFDGLRLAYTIDLSQLSAGSYWISIEMEDSVRTHFVVLTE